MTNPRWSRRLLAIFALEPGQGWRTLLVSSYLLLVIAVYLTLKSASKSLFLERLGALRLPWVTIVTAALVGVFVALYIRAARRLGPHQLAIGTLAFFIVNLLAFWWLDRLQPRWLYPAFYVWVGMFGVIATTQVWTLANELFTTREAKHVFGIVGAGGICGAISGGTLTRALAPRIGTVNLLLVAAVLLAVAAFVVAVVVRYRLPVQARADELPPPRRMLDSLGLVAGSRHLRLVAALVLVTALATKMVDWQFSAVAEVAFDDQDQRTAFFGTFDAATGVIGFLVQVLLTSRLLIGLGIGGAILVFPLVLTAGTLALIPTVSLWAAVLAKGGDQTLKHSVDRSGRELLFLPVSRTIKVQAKSVIDMVIDRSGDGLAGFVQLATIALVTAEGVTTLSMVRQMGTINLFFLGLWILIALRLRRSYVAELGDSIASGRVEVASWSESLASAETLQGVRRALESHDESTVLAALDLARANPQWDLTASLAALARDGSPEIRARSLAILLAPDNPDLPDGVAKAFADEDQALLAQCVDLELATDPAERQRHAEAILARAGGPARGAWLALMVRRLGPQFAPVARGLFEQLLDPRSSLETREVATTALGMLPANSELLDLLPPLLSDVQPRVAAAAAGAAGAVGSENMLAAIVPLLGASATRGAARDALRSRGAAAVPVLTSGAADVAIRRDARLRIPNVLAGVRAPEAVGALAQMFFDHDAELARRAGQALYRIRLKRPHGAMLSRLDVRRTVMEMARRVAWANDVLARLGPGGDDPAEALLAASLNAHARRAHSDIFRTLALCYPPSRMLDCRRSLLDGNRELRANATELLDNLVPRRLWRELLPVLTAEAVADGAGGGGRAQVLDELVECDHDWLRACALTVVGRAADPALRPAVERSRDHADPHVREAAARALKSMDGTRDTLATRTLVERVMALRRIDAFAATEPEQLSVIAAGAQEQVFPGGSVLCREGDPPGDLFVLLGGRVRVEREAKPVGELASGEALGTWALFDDDPSTLTATTVEETPVLRIDRGVFRDVLDEHPDIARSLIQQLVRRLRSLAEG